MEKLFINKTTYTQDIYVKFLNFHNKQYNFSYMLYTVFWAFIFFLCLFISFGSGLRIQGICMTIILICFISYRIFRPKMIVNSEMKSDKFTENNTNTFVFYDKGLEVSNKNGKFNFKYFLIRKVFETPEYFYLYVSKENAFLLSKSAFSLGTSEDFGTFIAKKCKGRFKVDKSVLK